MVQSCSGGFLALSHASRDLAWHWIVMAVGLGFHRKTLLLFPQQRGGEGDEGKLLHGQEYPPSCPAGCVVAMERHRNVAHSLCSTVAQLFLCLDRQSRVGAVSWQTPTGASLLCSGLIGCPRALGAAEGSWPILHQCMLKINMKE